MEALSRDPKCPMVSFFSLMPARLDSVNSVGSSPIDTWRSFSIPGPIRSSPTAVTSGGRPHGELCCKDRSVDPPFKINAFERKISCIFPIYRLLGQDRRKAGRKSVSQFWASDAGTNDCLEFPMFALMVRCRPKGGRKPLLASLSHWKTVVTSIAQLTKESHREREILKLPPMTLTATLS